MPAQKWEGELIVEMALGRIEIMPMREETERKGPAITIAVRGPLDPGHGGHSC